MRADAAWGLLLAAAAAGLLVLAYQPREMTIFSQADNMFWPRHVLWPLLALSLLLAANALVAGRRQEGSAPARLDRRPFARPLLLALGIGVALFLVDVIGFLPVVFAFCALARTALGRRHPLGALAFAAVVTLVVWGAFLKGLAVPLPRGIGIFRDFSFLIY